MWKPKKFGWIYPLSVLYVFTLTIPNSTAMYWAYGNQLLKNNNALATLDAGPARTAAIIFMVIHQVSLSMYLPRVQLVATTQALRR